MNVVEGRGPLRAKTYGTSAQNGNGATQFHVLSLSDLIGPTSTFQFVTLLSGYPYFIPVQGKVDAIGAAVRAWYFQVRIAAFHEGSTRERRNDPARLIRSDLKQFLRGVNSCERVDCYYACRDAGSRSKIESGSPSREGYEACHTSEDS
jgi:hypothetical protein